jgi:TPR repeat protein
MFVCRPILIVVFKAALLLQVEVWLSASYLHAADDVDAILQELKRKLQTGDNRQTIAQTPPPESNADDFNKDVFSKLDPPYESVDTPWKKRYNDVYASARNGETSGLATMAFWTRTEIVRGGIGVSEQLATQSADRGDPLGMFELAKTLMNQKKRDQRRLLMTAFPSMKKMADGGNSEAEMRVGNAYFMGLGTPPSGQDGFNYTMRAIDKGVPDAMWMFANMNSYGVGMQNFRQAAYDYFVKAANAGMGSAAYELATISGSGRGIDLPREQSARWLDRAVELGYFKAFALKGRNLFKEDKQAAIELFKLGAEREDSGALYLLAECYEEGDGVEQDKSKAEELYKRCVISEEAMPILSRTSALSNAKHAIERLASETKSAQREEERKKAIADKQLEALQELQKLGVKKLENGRECVDHLLWSGEATIQRFIYDPENPTDNLLLNVPINGRSDNYHASAVGVVRGLQLDDTLLRSFKPDEHGAVGLPHGEINGTADDRGSIPLKMFSTVESVYPKFKQWEKTAQENNVDDFQKFFDGSDASYEGNATAMRDQMSRGGSSQLTDKVFFEWTGGKAFLCIQFMTSVTRHSADSIDQIHILGPIVDELEREGASMLAEFKQGKRSGKKKIDELFQ